MSVDGARVAFPLFHAGDSGSNPTSTLQMRVERIPFLRALELNEQWHSSLPRFGTGFIKKQPFLCFGAICEGLIYAVAIWSNPVARLLPQQTWLELRRFAIAGDAPKNTASWMLGVMRRIISRVEPQVVNLISYQELDRHSGTIYKAAGWEPTMVNRDGNWTRSKRPRPAAQNPGQKQRWEYAMVRERKGGKP